MKKRKWIYVMKPTSYEIHCDKCGGENIEWSEFEHKIWCYDCQIDTDGFPGIFGGPIPLGVSQILGISFDRYNIKKNRIEYMRVVSGKVKWFARPERKQIEHKG